MSVVRKVRAVEKVFAVLDSEIKIFQNRSQIQCLTGCGKCCFNPDIEASPLEFLPLAFDLFLTKRIEDSYFELTQNTGSHCSLFRPKALSLDKGTCSQYNYRGLICRLFGYAAMRDKMGNPKFITCRAIKLSQPEKVTAVDAAITKGENPPFMSDYYFRLRSIDPELGTQRLPINDAIKKALEYVMAYYAYRRRPPLKGRRVA
ncbi:YkgJ family cysteine cluster protein [Roseivirga pacifica]|jgi:uncharacterized protein|uniref:YkgJ family cysteine cluster protein n=1 Tax=Roseivirga pacifica TaxID=1267423 RepID=UPI003BA934AF